MLFPSKDLGRINTWHADVKKRRSPRACVRILSTCCKLRHKGVYDKADGKQNVRKSRRAIEVLGEDPAQEMPFAKNALIWLSDKVITLQVRLIFRIP